MILLEAACRAGADVGEGLTVTELLRDGDRVTGVRTRRGSNEIEESARIVIGADGMRSTVARLAGANAIDFRETRTCGYDSFWSGVPVDGAEIAIREGAVERSFDEALDLAPSLAERVRSGERVERFYGTGELRSFAVKVTARAGRRSVTPAA